MLATSLKSIVNQKRGRAETAVAVIAVDKIAPHPFPFLKKLVHVAVVHVKRPRNMRLGERSGIANIDERPAS